MFIVCYYAYMLHHRFGIQKDSILIGFMCLFPPPPSPSLGGTVYIDHAERILYDRDQLLALRASGSRSADFLDLKFPLTFLARKDAGHNYTSKRRPPSYGCIALSLTKPAEKVIHTTKFLWCFSLKSKQQTNWSRHLSPLLHFPFDPPTLAWTTWSSSIPPSNSRSLHIVPRHKALISLILLLQALILLPVLTLLLSVPILSALVLRSALVTIDSLGVHRCTGTPKQKYSAWIFITSADAWHAWAFVTLHVSI